MKLMKLDKVIPEIDVALVMELEINHMLIGELR
jgi:hypothetical protein